MTRIARSHARARRPLRRLLPLAGLAALVGIVLGGPRSAAAEGCPSSNPPNVLQLVAGSGQTAKLGSAFQANLQVALANSNGCPVTGSLAGRSISFVAPSSGASGTFAASGSNVAVVGTDATGAAVAPAFTANDTAGSYSVRAESDYGTVELSLTNTASGVVATITAIGQTERSATVNSSFDQPLQAQVLDAGGRPVQGVSVTFSLGTGVYGAGGGFLGGGGQATTLTNASGQATSPPFMANGTPGRFTATASTTDPATVATFNLANRAATTSIAAITPAAQTTTVETRYRRRLRARVLDSSGQPIEGATVTFMLPTAETGAGASFPGGGSQATATTDADGRATSPPLRANSTAGRFTATATIAGVDKPVSYSLRNLAGKPTAITAGAASGESTPTGSRFPIRLAVTVSDADDNPVSGALVTFTAPARGPSGRFGARRTRTVRVRTNASGIAVAPVFTANAKSGGYVVTATLRGTRQRGAFALVNESA